MVSIAPGKLSDEPLFSSISGSQSTAMFIFTSWLIFYQANFLLRFDLIKAPVLPPLLSRYNEYVTFVVSCNFNSIVSNLISIAENLGLPIIQHYVNEKEALEAQQDLYFHRLFAK